MQEKDIHFRTHNIPCTVVEMVKALGVAPTPDPVEVCSDPTNIVASFVDKIGDSWLPKPKQKTSEIDPVISQQDDEISIGLLSSFKEVQEVLVPVLSRPDAQPRTSQRLQSEQSYSKGLFSDLVRVQAGIRTNQMSLGGVLSVLRCV